MRIDTLDTSRQVIIVAEIGNNHEGSYSLAEELIGLAAQSGADAVKFQTFCTEHYVSRSDEARFKRLKSFELSFDEFEKLSLVAKQADLVFLSTPFDVQSAAFLNSLVPAFKISSGDNTFYPLLETVAHFGKPVLLSSGLATMPQLAYAKALLERIWLEQESAAELAILHCVSSYPVPPHEANLQGIRTLQQALNCCIGYSDHTVGIEAAVLSVALGARIIEKHFTIDHHYSDFRDHQLSANPDELKQLVQRIREAETLLGPGHKVPQASEKQNLPLLRRSIVAQRDLPAGHVLQWGDLTWVRPSGGLPPGNEGQLLGRPLQHAVKMGDFIWPAATEEAPLR